jgi:glycosyltransferase involved in cell wall biosynthesis
MKKKILFIVYSNLKHDARVSRHINFLKHDYLVTVICLEADPGDEYRIVQLPPHKLTLFIKAISGMLLLLRLYPWAYRVLYPYQFLRERLGRDNFDVIVANDVETLPLAFAIASPHSKIILDAHEYAPRHFENVRRWRMFFQRFNIHLCKKYIPKLGGMITVGRKIAEEYEKHFGVLPAIITNAPPKQNLQPSPVGATIRLVHHGIGTPSRKIELMIEMMKLLPDHFQLDLILLTPPTASPDTIAYMAKLKALASFTERIKFISPIPIEEIVSTLNRYDIGVIVIPPINFNYENTLPNKFFDYIQARVALAIGPTPEMAAIVREYDLGIVSTDFTSQALASQLATLTREKIQQFKINTEKAAQEYCAERNGEILVGVVERASNNSAN